MNLPIPPSKRNLRLSVAAILRNASGRVLICERLDEPGSWQFPQGSVGRTESLEDALRRELFEEIAIRPDHYRIIVAKGPYHYLFTRPKKGFDGKQQHYFLCDFFGPDTAINVQTEHPEFRNHRWIHPSEFLLQWISSAKQPVYRSVFQDFFDQTL
jgi:putative (di)nucleoside polyphosphate hydrolase